MKLYLNLLGITFILMLSCNPRNEKLTSHNDTHETHHFKVEVKDQYEIDFSSGQCSNSLDKIIFLTLNTGFKNDLITLKINNEIKTKHVSTNKFTNSAGLIEIGKQVDVKSFSFSINKGPEVVVKDFNCTYLFADYSKGNKLTVHSSETLY
ncbi:MAG: hypothetical protein HRT68_14420 [Flavobacteriaceae bacterium]|nr:hypothetical protein [Flavobacteriaceae bacterium]